MSRATLIETADASGDPATAAMRTAMEWLASHQTCERRPCRARSTSVVQHAGHLQAICATHAATDDRRRHHTTAGEAIRQETRELAAAGALVGLVVPYDTTITHAGHWERFAIGAFAGRTPGPVPVDLDHDDRAVVGATVWETVAGLYFAVAGSVAPDVLARVRDHHIRGVSVSFQPIQTRDEDGVRVITAADVRSISLATRPAYVLSWVALDTPDARARIQQASTRAAQIATDTRRARFRREAGR